MVSARNSSARVLSWAIDISRVSTGEATVSRRGVSGMGKKDRGRELILAL
jgi:hypothetical protein